MDTERFGPSAATARSHGGEVGLGIMPEGWEGHRRCARAAATPSSGGGEADGGGEVDLGRGGAAAAAMCPAYRATWRGGDAPRGPFCQAAHRSGRLQTCFVRRTAAGTEQAETLLEDT